MKNIFFVATSGIYEHWRNAFAKHTKTLTDAVSVTTGDLVRTRLDHADVIIYFDESTAAHYGHIAMNVQMINHAAAMSKKGIKTLIITRSGNPGEIGYRVWQSGSQITELGQISQIWYAFHTDKVGPAGHGDGGFDSIDWVEFEKRYILDKS